MENIPSVTSSAALSSSETIQRFSISSLSSIKNFMPHNDLAVVAGYSDFCFLGVTIVIGGQMFDWNVGLHNGFGNFALATLVMLVGYICLCACLAEMTSMLPFSGGSYGYARVTVSIFGGFIVGCCETIEYVLYVSTSVFALGDIITQSLEISRNYQPLFWFITYAVAISFQTYGGFSFWRLNKIIAIISLLVVVLYCCSTVELMNFKEHAKLDDSENVWFGGEPGWGFMRVLPLASWFYVGIEAIPFAGRESKSPKRDVSLGIILGMTLMAITSIAILFSVASVGPTVNSVAKADSPLSYGFSQIFNISTNISNILVIPPIFATAYGFMYGYGRQVFSLSESGLLPECLGWTTPGRGTPYMALIVTSVFSYAVALIIWYDPSLQTVMFNVCIIGSYVTYLAVFLGFISFRLYFTRLDRSNAYESPFGLYGAVVGVLVFGLCILSVAGFQDDNGLAVLVFLGIILAASMYYMCIASSKQKFSKMEKSVMLVAHVLKADMKTKYGRVKRHRSYGWARFVYKRVKSAVNSVLGRHSDNKSVDSMKQNGAEQQRGSHDEAMSSQDHRSRDYEHDDYDGAEMGDSVTYGDVKNQPAGVVRWLELTESQTRLDDHKLHYASPAGSAYNSQFDADAIQGMEYMHGSMQSHVALKPSSSKITFFDNNLESASIILELGGLNQNDVGVGDADIIKKKRSNSIYDALRNALVASMSAPNPKNHPSPALSRNNSEFSFRNIQDTDVAPGAISELGGLNQNDVGVGDADIIKKKQSNSIYDALRNALVASMSAPNPKNHPSPALSRNNSEFSFRNIQDTDVAPGAISELGGLNQNDVGVGDADIIKKKRSNSIYDALRNALVASMSAPNPKNHPSPALSRNNSEFSFRNIQDTDVAPGAMVNDLVAATPSSAADSVTDHRRKNSICSSSDDAMMVPSHTGMNTPASGTGAMTPSSVIGVSVTKQQSIWNGISEAFSQYQQLVSTAGSIGSSGTSKNTSPSVKDSDTLRSIVDVSLTHATSDSHVTKSLYVQKQHSSKRICVLVPSLETSAQSSRYPSAIEEEKLSDLDNLGSFDYVI